MPDAAAGDAFQTFYQDTAPRLLRQLLALTRNTAEAQDCLQEAYARAALEPGFVAPRP